MPTIKPRHIEETRSVSGSVPVAVADDLALYCDWIDENAGYIIGEALKRVFDRDSDFQKYKGSRPLVNPKPAEGGPVLAGTLPAAAKKTA